MNKYLPLSVCLFLLLVALVACFPPPSSDLTAEPVSEPTQIPEEIQPPAEVGVGWVTYDSREDIGAQIELYDLEENEVHVFIPIGVFVVAVKTNTTSTSNLITGWETTEYGWKQTGFTSTSGYVYPNESVVVYWFNDRTDLFFLVWYDSSVWGSRD